MPRTSQLNLVWKVDSFSCPRTVKQCYTFFIHNRLDRIGSMPQTGFMKTYYVLLFCCLFITTTPLVTLGEDALHTFTTPDGRSLKAVIKDYDDRTGKIQIEREDGKKLWTLPTAFSEPDREYIRQWIAVDQFMSTTKFKIKGDSTKGEKRNPAANYAPPWERDYDRSFVVESSVATWDPASDKNPFYEQGRLVNAASSDIFVLIFVSFHLRKRKTNKKTG